MGGDEERLCGPNPLSLIQIRGFKQNVIPLRRLGPFERTCDTPAGTTLVHVGSPLYKPPAQQFCENATNSRKAQSYNTVTCSRN